MRKGATAATRDKNCHGAQKWYRLNIATLAMAPNGRNDAYAAAAIHESTALPRLARRRRSGSLPAITYVVAGHFEHADSIGGGGILEAGGVQRMTLGSGAQHSERNHSQTEEMQFLQLWILPDRRGLKPELVKRQHTTEDRHSRWLRKRHLGTWQTRTAAGARRSTAVQ